MTTFANIIHLAMTDTAVLDLITQAPAAAAQTFGLALADMSVLSDVLSNSLHETVSNVSTLVEAVSPDDPSIW